MDSKKVLTVFLEAWAAKDWNLMYINCQKTWCEGHKVSGLKSLFSSKDVPGARELKEFQIISFTNSGNVRADYVIECVYGDGSIKTHSAIIICESAPYSPATYGDWGVNPISIIRVVDEIKAPVKKGK